MGNQYSITGISDTDLSIASVSAGTVTGTETNDMIRSETSTTISGRILSDDSNRIKHEVKKIASKLDISPNMANHLMQLQGFKVIVIVDDSGSMNTPIQTSGTKRTRWNELHQFLPMIIETAVIFDPKGVDVYFLNGDHLENVTDSSQLDDAFSRNPEGHTPLSKTLENILRSQEVQGSKGQGYLLYIATDGIPTDVDGNENVAEVERLLRDVRHAETTYVQILICTDENRVMTYLSEWDRSMRNVDVTCNFLAERKKIRECHGDNDSFSMGDYLVKCIVGPIVADVDNLNDEVTCCGPIFLAIRFVLG